MIKRISFIPALVLLLTPVPSMAQCATFNPNEVFFEEYRGPVWKVPNGHRVITWGVDGSFRAFSSDELNIISDSFRQWDQYLDSITFIKTDSLPAEVTVSYAPLNWYQGYWNMVGNRYTIRLNSNGQPAHNKQIFHYMMVHELGNVLGLGDIKKEYKESSAMKDGLMEYNFSGPTKFDEFLIKSVYEEKRTCDIIAQPTVTEVAPTPFPTPTPTVESKPLLNEIKPLPNPSKTIKPRKLPKKREPSVLR